MLKPTVGCLFALAVTLAASGAGAAETGGAAMCKAAKVAVQVLGSGGPIAEGGRAGTSYLFYVDGAPRVLVDSGPGSFLRFAEAGATVASLQAIAISHFHADHSVDLPGILNSGSFEDLGETLLLVGPDGKDRFPGTQDFLSALLSKENGAWRYLGGFLDGSDERPKLDIREVPSDPDTAAAVSFEISPAIRMTAIPVHHGDVPALGFELAAHGVSLVLGGDQSFLAKGFESQLAGSRPTMLIAHHVIPEGAGQPRGLHRPPKAIGELANTLGAQRLVLSHNMNRSLARLDEGLAAIRASYSGPIDVAKDLDCFVLLP
jgi:ribonuclease BN (tRNA processing enzyme)